MTQAVVVSGRAQISQSLISADATVVVAEYPLNRHQAFRAEIIHRCGKVNVSLSRWKLSNGVNRKTGQSFEFGAHRLRAVLRLLADVERTLQAQQPFFDGNETDLDDGEALYREVDRILANQGGAR